MATIGADPEVFIKDTRHGGVVPICGLIGGTKEKPLPLGDLGEGFAVQEDNVMAEFNVPAARKARVFTENINRGLGAVRDLVRTKSEFFDLDFASARLFAHPMLRTKQAAVFGCSPDFNAYQDGMAYRSVRPLELEEPEGGWRFAGGHVHLGYAVKDGQELPPPYVIARFCDVFMGLPSLELDKQGRRRTLYGQAGRYRPTAYGIEYRTLSNFWIFDKYLTEVVADRALRLCYLIESSDERLQHFYQEIPWGDVSQAINTEDAQMAADLTAYITSDVGMSEYI